MEWLSQLLRPEVLSLLIPIIVIVGIFCITVIKAHNKHQERLEKIKQGFNPDV